MLLNFDGTLPPNNQLRMVSQAAPPGASAPTVGTSLICDNCQTLGQFAFDVRLSVEGLP